MNNQGAIRKACRELLGLRSAQGGNVMATFALALIPIVGAVGGAVDYSRASSARAAMQSALDSAALGTIPTASTQTSGQIQSTALALFNASFNRPDAGNVAVTTSYDAATNTLTVNGSSSIKSDFISMIGISEMSVSGVSTAVMGGPRKWQICVLITEPVEKHTLKVEGGAKIDFDNCMVQVNTANWDAVESRGGGYIHSKNGENCFVGDIHYGDVLPPKNPTCTFFKDPFVGYKMPASAGTCNFTNKVVNLAGTVLTPGTYCGGINITADTTFSKGLYIIKDGSLKVSGSKNNAGVNLTAKGVTFLLTGQNAGVNISTAGTFTHTPASNGDAGVFDGFLYYLDQTIDAKGKPTYAQSSVFSGTTVNANGIIYLAGQEFVVDSGAVFNIKPGSVVAGYILPEGGATFNLTGEMPSSSFALEAMQKTGYTQGPTLVK